MKRMTDKHPSIKEMLTFGKQCGVETLIKSFHNYIRHSESFFEEGKYNEQYFDLTEALRHQKFMYGDRLLQITIDQALERLESRE